MFVPYQFQYTCVFLNNELKRNLIRDNQSINVLNSYNEIRSEFFFLAIFNGSILFVLNKLFHQNNIDSKQSMVIWISDFWINTMIINFYKVKIEEK